jgi:Ca2+-binding EF-hand superfamily protein
VIDPNILVKLVSYKGISALRKEAMNVLVKMLDVKHVSELRLAFHTIDKDQTGMITVEELQEALTSQD